MNEPAEMTAEDARRQAGQALLLARIFATVVTFGCLTASLIACSSAARFRELFAELGVELPEISRMVAQGSSVLLAGMVVVAGVTVFFIWARGKTAAWMAGLGLLLLAVSVPITVFAMFLPLMKVMSDMGAM